MTDHETISGVERWMIGLLLSGVAALVWFVILDLKADVKALEKIVNVNSGRISVLEQRTANHTKAMDKLELAVDEHRRVTEKR